MDQKQFEAMLSDAETRLRRLKLLYEQWFMGFERTEPATLRKDLDDLLGRLRKEQSNNTALRFRLQQLVQRYTTFTTHWRRVGRQIEEGTYQRDVIRAKRRKARAEPERDEAAPDIELSYDVDLDLDIDIDTALDDVERAVEETPRAPAKPAQAVGIAPPQAAAGIAPPQAAVGRAQLRVPPKPAAVGPGAIGVPVPAGAALAGAPVPAGLAANALAGRAPAPAASLGRAPAGAPPPSAARVAGRPLSPFSMPPPGKTNDVAKPQAPQPASAASAAAASSAFTKPASPRPVATTAGASPQPSAASAAHGSRDNGGGFSPDDVQRVYSQYLAARKQNAERTDNVKRDTIEKTIRTMLPQLEKKHAGKKIDFEVVVKDGKVALKPTAK